MVEEFVPIALFVVGGVVFWIFFLYRHRSRVETHKTIRLALEKGNDLSPEFIQQLTESMTPKANDLRRGIIWISLAVALVLCGLAVPDPTGDAFRGCLASAAFPFTIGIAYLVMWRYGSLAAPH